MRIRGLTPMARAIEAQRLRATKPVRPLTRPGVIPVEAYTLHRHIPLTGGTGAAKVASDGSATITLGPQGVGTVWYPQSVAIATTTGAADTSTCTVYVGPLSLLSQIGAQSYAGGGDMIGLPVPPLFPGYFIVAVWAGAVSGDQATAAIYGEMDALGVRR